MNEPVRLAIHNDYEIVVRGLVALLEPHAERVRVVDLSVGEPPEVSADVTLFDVFGSGEVHTGDVERVLEDPAAGAVAVYTWNFSEELVERAARLGIRGYLSKALGATALVDAIERLAAGERVVNPGHDGSRPSAVRRWPGKGHDLTEREAEVLALITQGYDNQAIAERLFVSPNTIKTRIRTLYRKMGFDNRVQAAIWGVKHGFETDSDRSPDLR